MTGKNFSLHDKKRTLINVRMPRSLEWFINWFACVQLNLNQAALSIEVKYIKKNCFDSQTVQVYNIKPTDQKKNEEHRLPKVYGWSATKRFNIKWIRKKVLKNNDIMTIIIIIIMIIIIIIDDKDDGDYDDDND